MHISFSVLSLNLYSVKLLTNAAASGAYVAKIPTFYRQNVPFTHRTLAISPTALNIDQSPIEIDERFV
ncbi:MAG: hypothetical protein ACI9NN_001608 [Bacteroidia bacterium]